MGEVYRARDTSLDRSVAIKVLPGAVARDPERLARFAREARTLAALNHQHIAQIYGLEQSASTCALAMEFVDGEELAERIARGPLTWTEARAIAIQIAEALEAAHQQGIIHRDLKPGNIRVTPDGVVKVLDFGLAKALDPATGDRSGESAGDLVNSPTITSPAGVTQAGSILGTAAYMSPEQAKGHAADKRSDIWAFGCVLYEMLTSRRAFAGDDVLETLAAIVRDEPDYAAIPSDVPAAVRELIARCLAKDRRSRILEIAVARYAIEGGPLTSSHHTQRDPTPASPNRWRAIAIAAIVLALTAGGFAISQIRGDQADSAPRVQRFSIVTPPGAPIGGDAYIRQPEIAISRDGSRIVYVPIGSGGGARLIVRSLDRFETAELTNLGPVASGPFFSPDGAWIGYRTGAEEKPELAKIPASGGSPVIIGEHLGNLRGASWGDDDQIVFATSFVGAGLHRTRAAAGSRPETLTKPKTEDGEIDHLWPDVLPDGKHVLFSIAREGGPDASDVAVLSLETRTWRVLVKGGAMPRYLDSGHIVYSTPGRLRAVGFDLATLAVTTGSEQVLDGVLTKDQGAADFGVATNGTLVYVPGRVMLPIRRFAWATLSGAVTPIAIQPGPYRDGVLSPDGRFIATEMDDGSGSGIFVIDLARETTSRLTPAGLVATSPAWSPDGRAIAFTAERQGDAAAGIFRITSDGAGQPERITTAASGRQVVESWSPDGRQIFFVLAATTSGDGPAIHRVSTTPGANDVVRVADWTADPRPSPNGKWLAHITLRAFPQIGLHIRPLANWDASRVVVSPSGQAPIWRADGRELYYRDGQAVLAVAIDESNGLTVGKPRKLLDPAPERLYGVSPDGKRFLVADRPADATPTPLTEIRVVTNWFEELKGIRFPAQ
jgi:serine/threonine-protein kinase